MKMELAKALLRRKELQERLHQQSKFKDSDIYKVIAKRINVQEGTDDIEAKIPKLKLKQVMSEWNLTAKQLRLVDAVIQKANWTTEIEVEDIAMEDPVFDLNDEKKE